MSKAQELWDEGYPVKKGQILPPGTETIQQNSGPVGGVSLITIARGSALEIGDYLERNLRTVEPLPDLDDTGNIRVEVFHDREVMIMLVDTEMEAGYDLTEAQARNLVRRLTEVLDNS